MAEVVYQVRVRGTVSSRVLRVFEELDMQSDTLLTGVVQDQAALHGLLERIRDLGLELIDVHQIPQPTEPTTEPPRGPR